MQEGDEQTGWGPGEGGDQGSGYEWVDLYPVYAAPDEAAAIHVRSLLVSAGLDARIRSAQVPWLDGILASGVGYWGQVLVPRREVVAALALVEALRTESEGEQEDSRPGD